MKKVIAVLFALCLALTLSVPAFADMGGPAFSAFDVTLNADTQYFRNDWDSQTMQLLGTLPAGTVVTVQYEYTENGVDYASISIKDREDDEWYYIRLSDFQMGSEVYGPEKGNILREPVRVLVIAKEGVGLYAGPNRKFALLTTIPQNISLTYIVDNGDDGEATWAYVTYREFSGWIYIGFEEDTGLARCCGEDEPMHLWALKDTTIYAGISDGNLPNELTDGQKEDLETENMQPADPVVGTFTRSSRCECLYYVYSVYGEWYHISVDGQSGWVFFNRQTGNIACKEGKHETRLCMFTTACTLTLYTEPDSSARSTSATAAANTEIEKEYQTNNDYDLYYYVTVDGKSGWVDSSDISESTAERVEQGTAWAKYEEERYVGAAGGTTIYSDVTDRSSSIGSVPAGQHMSILYEGYCRNPGDYYDGDFVYRVRSGSTTGWVWEDELELLEDVQMAEPKTPDAPDGYRGTWRFEEWNEEAKAAKSDPKYAEDVRTDEEDGEDSGRKQNGIHMTPIVFVLICVAVAALLTLTVCVTLLLIRHKRK